MLCNTTELLRHREGNRKGKVERGKKRKKKKERKKGGKKGIVCVALGQKKRK